MKSRRKLKQRRNQLKLFQLPHYDKKGGNSSDHGELLVGLRFYDAVPLMQKFFSHNEKAPSIEWRRNGRENQIKSFAIDFPSSRSRCLDALPVN